ncbi:MAG TPA: sugar transferase [Bryobacteraceae bacterium]|jgi:exopolysaccharide biosynthesis polyprenyl glycosylphosphotransferase
MFSSQHRKARLLFELSDLLLTIAAFYTAYAVRAQITFLENYFFISPSERTLVIGFCLITAVALGRWLDVYEKLDSGQPAAILRDAFSQSAYLSLALLVFQYLLRLDLSRPFLGFFAIFSWLFFSLFRLLSGPLIGWVRKKFGALRYILIVGSGPRALQLAETIEAANDRGLRIKGFVVWDAADTAADSSNVSADLGYPIYSLNEITPLLRRHVIDEIVFAVEAARLPDIEEVLLLCDEEGVRTRIAVDFFPHVNSDVGLERLGSTPLLTFSATPDDEVRLLVKRSLDVVLASLALVLAAPFMAVIAAAIRLTSPGKAIFRQERCGLNGRRFICYKFRSMRETSDVTLQAAQLNGRAPRLRSIATKISPDDPRVTPVGRWLRKFSLDELPQFYNVLKGDMSLVGPRPAIPSEVEQYQRWQRRRLRMRPGITCLWALNGRDRLDFDTWMRLDMSYIDNWSLGLDCKIILKTIPQVLLGRDAN